MKLILVTALAALVAGCASTGQKKVAGGGDTSPAPVFRYLAWYEGDFQNDYQINRDLAENRFQDLEKSPPAVTDTEAYLEYLSLMDAAGRHEEAAKRLKAYLVANPNEKRAVFVLAVHYWRVKKRGLAEYFFAQLEKDGSFPWKALLYNNLGMFALEDKNRALAIDYFEKAVKANPPIAAPLVNLGAVYLQSRSYAAAEPLFVKARDLDDEFEDATLGLGIALEGQGKFEEAHRVYSEFAGKNSNALSVVYNDAILLGNRLNKKAEAAEQMLRYIQRGGKETARAQENLRNWR